MSQIRVIFYDTPNGKEPANEFISGLEPKMRAKVLRTVELLENNGPDLRPPISAPLGDGIFELRTQMGKNISRVLYFFSIGNVAILTHGFIKKNTKDPSTGNRTSKTIPHRIFRQKGE